jgi:hypothetical protein
MNSLKFLMILIVCIAFYFRATAYRFFDCPTAAPMHKFPIFKGAN